MKKKTLIWIIVIIIILALTLILGKGLSSEKNTPEVKVETVASGNIKSYLSTTGEVSSKNKKDYYAPQLKVESLKVKVGDKVNSGDILATFDTSSVPYGTTVDSEIEADITGTVTAVNILEGVTALATAPAITVQDLSSMQMRIYVGNYDSSKIAIGQTATITDQDKTYNAQITFIDPAATKIQSTSGTDSKLGVTLDITDDPTGLVPGFSYDVDILTNEVNGVLTLPVECISSEKDGNFAYVVQGENIVARKPVELGLQSTENSEIISGLSDGDKIIANPSAFIVDGVKVKVTN